MRWVIVVEVILTAIAALTFVTLYSRTHWPTSRVAKHVLAFSFVVGVESIALLLLLLGIILPLWAYALIYGAVAAVSVHRLILFLQSREHHDG